MKSLKSSDFSDRVYERQGGNCLVLACDAPWTDVAHIWPSGMGGRESTYRDDNLVGLCHACHDAYDGNRAWLMRTLMEAHAQDVWRRVELRREWNRLHPPTPEEAIAAEIERRYGPKTEAL